MLFKGFDFAFLDPSIDFYAIDITEFNNCTDKFKCGTYPFSDSGHYSLVSKHFCIKNEKKNWYIIKFF